MEERRFDAWSRSLGAATSRRQLFKGVLGGALALLVGRTLEPAVAKAAETCDRQECEHKVQQYFTNCIASCAITGGFRNTRDPRLKAFCRANCYLASKALGEDCKHNATGCFGPDEVCCNQQCVTLENDPHNCGNCGHACPDGHACVDGQCECDEDETSCAGQCVDTQTDNANCGTCGHVCSSCETCLGGECQPLDCGSGQVCCQHLCIPECQGGPPDPATCLCDVCDGQANGLSCGSAKVCCDQHCMSEACHTGKTFDLNSCDCQCTTIECPEGQTQDTTTCQCVCTPIECPNGESQDPLTCQCINKCMDVACGICQTCDPSSGSCVNADNNSDCSGGNVCCDGVCQSDCTCATLTCQNDCCPSDDYYCCEANDGCCPQVTITAGTHGAYCLAPGPGTLSGYDGITVGGCCQPDKLMKLSVIDDSTEECGCGSGTNYGIFCDGNMPATYLGIEACSCGPWLGWPMPVGTTELAVPAGAIDDYSGSLN